MSESNKWDQRYGAAVYAYGTTANDFLRSSLHHLPPAGDALCLAEGEGRNGVFLAEQGNQVTAVDSSEVGLAKAQALAKTRDVQITTIAADLADFRIAPQSFDIIVSIFCHLPPVLRKKIHQHVVDGLRPGGVFILEAYTPAQLDYGTGGPPVAELLMNVDELRSELGSLKILHALETEREVIEGHLHTGLGAVVQLIAKKE